jgi:hypothetical protein
MWDSVPSVNQGASAILRVPEGWSPHVDDREYYWFWTPPDWRPTQPLSPGCCRALAAGDALLEVFVLKAPEGNPDPAAFFGGLGKNGALKRHPGAKVYRDASFSPKPFDSDHALHRFAALRNIKQSAFLIDMKPPARGYRCTVEYKEADGKKSVTDFYSLSRGDTVLQLNMKTYLAWFGPLKTVFEQVATSVMISGYVG